jgi:hypothetical protein
MALMARGSPIYAVETGYAIASIKDRDATWNNSTPKKPISAQGIEVSVGLCGVEAKFQPKRMLYEGRNAYAKN